MDKVSTVETHGHAHGHAHDHAHEELGFWRKYVFSQDHKVIGIQYAITALLFLLFGFGLMMLMRWQLAYPGKPIPLIGGLFSAANAPGLGNASLSRKTTYGVVTRSAPRARHSLAPARWSSAT